MLLLGKDEPGGGEPPRHVPPQEVGGTPVNPDRRMKRRCGATDSRFGSRASLDSSRAIMRKPAAIRNAAVAATPPINIV